MKRLPLISKAAPLFVILATIISMQIAKAGDLTTSVYGDAYYSYNLNSPVPQQTGYRSYDSTNNSFELSDVAFVLQKEMKDYGFLVQFDFGPQADVVNGTGNGRNLSQAYLTLKCPTLSGWSFDLGKFYSHVGFEATPTKDNWNYSRSSAAAYGGPNWHVGLRAKAPTSGQLASSFYVLNGWGDPTTGNLQDNNKNKSFGAQFVFSASDKLSVTYNGLWGPEKANNNADMKLLNDFNVLFKANAQLQLAADVLFGSEENEYDAANTVSNDDSDSEWSAIVLYARYQMNDRYYLSPRLEFYEAKEDDGQLGLTNGGTFNKEKLTSITLTLGQKLGDGLDAKYELRNDSSDNDNAFQDGASDRTDSQTTLTAALLFQF